MTDAAYLLMMSGVVRPCPDCRDERIFVITDECESDRCEFCCTTCGAAILVDPIVDTVAVRARVA